MGILDIGDLPPELTSNPLAYVAVCGLDVENNNIHRTIWDSFISSRQERVPLNLQLVPPNHEFPQAKQKRTNYDRYVPKGILKTNWLHKHLNEVPAVAVQFVDLDWDSPAWAEKRSECASKLESLKQNLLGMNTKLSLVLIQKRASLPGTDDQIAAERAASLCSACDLSGKTLFVLPHSDHLYGYTLRLQNAFYELAQAYYHHESRYIKNHRDNLNKTTHQLLFVRHQFKIAFMTELKQDLSTSLKNYKQAYINLMEVRACEANMLEIKTIAGFINYKICRLFFISGTPLEAISQFRKHVDIFKNKVGHAELAFEHSAWMSKQFSHFGDLFEDAVQQGLTAIQTQHPGFYYQQAANQGSMRKSLCHKLCKSVQEPPDFDVLEGADSLEFYGQRPWRACCQSLEPPDPETEMQGILALKYKEYHEVNHSMIIIPLLSSAVAQFKKYKCPRMKRQLTVEMGEEYYSYKDYKQALTLLKHVLWDYRLEKWRPIVSSILYTALRSAYLSANLQQYVSLGIETISNWTLFGNDEKLVVQNNINNILQRKAPLFPMVGISDQDTKDAEKLWLDVMASLKEPIFTIQMSAVIPFIECKAGFASEHYMADQKVTVNVYFRMNCPQPVSFSKLTVLFSNECYNRFCEIPSVCDKSNSAEDNNLCKLYLVPRNTHTFNFTFIPDLNDIGKFVQITSVALHMGSNEHICAILHWATPTTQNRLTYADHANVKPGSFRDDVTFQHIVVQPFTRILTRSALISIDMEHQPPALMNEFYAILLTITNNEANAINNVTLAVSLKESQEQYMQENTHLSEQPVCGEKFVQTLNNIALDGIEPGKKLRKYIYMRATEVVLRTLVVEVTYDINIEMDEKLLNCSCKKTQEMEISSADPFEFIVKFLNMKFEEQHQIRAEEPFLVKIDIHSYSVLPLTLVDSVLELSNYVTSEDQNEESVLKNLTLNINEAATECLCLVSKKDCPAKVEIGSYCLKWKRNSSLVEEQIVETVISLPAVEVTNPPVYLELSAPAHGWVRTPMTVTYTIHNRLMKVQDVELIVDNSDAFMYAGNKQMNFRILPRNMYRLMYNLYPLTPGYVPLPRLRITVSPKSSSELSLDNLISQMIPSHIFVMPQGKGGDDAERLS